MPSDRTTYRFVQVSDIHLDSKFGSTRLMLPTAKRQQLNRDVFQSLFKAFELADEHHADAILIPGDLWDSETITSQSVNALIEVILQVPKMAVIIAPGNHDYYSKDSLYNEEVVRIRGMRHWPANVHIFRSPAFTTFKHPLRPDISYTGRAFTKNVPVTERLLSNQLPKDSEASLNILLFHGSLDGYTGEDANRPGKLTAPFSAAELDGLRFDYAAIGHYHTVSRIVYNDRLVGAYSGCIAGRGVDECGPRYALLGTVERTAEGAKVELQEVEVAQRRIISISCDVTGVTSNEVSNDVHSSLDKQGARAGADIVHVRLEGRHPTGAEPTYVLEQLRDKYFHVAVEDVTRPDYLTERIDPRTTEGKFVQAMLQMKKQAESSEAGMGTSDPAVVEDALYYGLDALKQKRITIRHVD